MDVLRPRDSLFFEKKRKESSRRELGSCLCDESTCRDWSFKLRSCSSVVDLQLGRMMEAAELTAHASTWISSEPLNQDMDAQLRYLLVMLTSGPALQITRQQTSGVEAFRDLARRYNPRSQTPSLAQLQEIMHFDIWEPAGVTDPMIVFEKLVGEYQTSSGEALCAQVKCAVLLERVPPELRTHLLLTCGSRPDYAIRDGQWKVTRWRDGHGSQAIQRQWEKCEWKSTLCTETMS